MRKALWLIIPLLAAGAAHARTAAPPPAKPVGPEFFSGRWFEIARTFNANQKDCEAPTYDFTGPASQPGFVLTCRKGSPGGPKKTLNARIRLPESNDRAKFRVTAMAGLVNQDYVVLDHAADYSWAMMGTTGGNYVWLMARQPGMDADKRAALTQRIAQLGYDTGKLVFPKF